MFEQQKGEHRVVIIPGKALVHWPDKVLEVS